jgi:CRP-like cAMP-binding protein
MSPPPATTGQPAAEDPAQSAKIFFLKIQSFIKEGNILGAEEMREKLMTAYPMALSEIIQSAELIEEAKSAAIDKNHVAIWDKLYGNLSSEEKNCLFFSLKKIVVPPGKIILAHGAFNTRLFFIDSGQVTIYLPKGDKHIVLAQLGRGDILGEYTFSTISLCSATAVSHTEVHMMYLESAAADGWEQKQPGLYDKLIDFCIKFGRVDEIISRKKLEKRTSVRYALEGRVLATLLTKEGKKTETYFRGNLSDISATGTCFLIKLSKKTTARALLARHLLLSFSFGEGKIAFSAVGKVVAVSFHLYNDYSVHIRFTKELPEDQIQKATFQGK